MLPSIPSIADVDGGVTKRTAAAATLFAAVMADSPLGYWRDNTGTDSSGNGLTLTPFGSPATGVSLDTSDAANASVTFNGTNNIWNSGLSAAFDLTAAVSISFLMNPTALGHADLVNKGSSPPYGVYLDSGVLHATVKIGGVTIIADGATSISTNTKYVVGMAFDGATVKLYVNGALDGSAVAVGALDVANGSGFTIGLFSNGYTGRLDEIAVYNHALSLARFAAYNGFAA